MPVDFIAAAGDLTTEEKIKSLRGKIALYTRNINANKRGIIYYGSPDYAPSFLNSSTGAEMIAYCEKKIIKDTAERARIAGLVAELQKEVR
jgi:hypothetical protein